MREIITPDMKSKDLLTYRSKSPLKRLQIPGITYRFPGYRIPKYEITKAILSSQIYLKILQESLGMFMDELGAPLDSL